MSVKSGTWTNGKKSVNGWWSYEWTSGTFSVTLNKKDSITGANTRHLTVYGDTPEWGNWKLVK